MIVLSILAVITAGITAWIAWRQYATTRLQTKQPVYSKRLEVYVRVKDFLGTCLCEKIRDTDVVEFNDSVSEAPFLFDRTIDDYIDKIYHKAMLLAGLQAAPAPPQSKKLTEMKIVREWLSNEYRTVRSHFSAYLTFAKKEST